MSIESDRRLVDRFRAEFARLQSTIGVCDGELVALRQLRDALAPQMFSLIDVLMARLAVVEPLVLRHEALLFRMEVEDPMALPP